MKQSEQERKLAFHEIDNGLFAAQAQDAFEKATLAAVAMNGPAEVIMRIMVRPSDNSTRFATMTWSVAKRNPPIKSANKTVRLKDGIIVADGDNEAATLQLNLDFPELSPSTQKEREVHNG